MANIPTSNRLAIRLAVRSGFTSWGLNRASVLKGGELIDQLMLGLSK